MGSPRRSGTGSAQDDPPQALRLICATGAGFDRLSQPSNHQECRLSRLKCKPRRCSAWSHSAYRSILMCESFSRRKRSLIFSHSSFHCLTCMARSDEETSLRMSEATVSSCMLHAMQAWPLLKHLTSFHHICCALPRGSIVVPFGVHI